MGVLADVLAERVVDVLQNVTHEQNIDLEDCRHVPGVRLVVAGDEHVLVLNRDVDESPDGGCG